MARAYASGEAVVAAQDGRFVLRTDRFSHLDDRDAERAANLLLASACALLHVYVGFPSQVLVESITCPTHHHGFSILVSGTARSHGADAIPNFCAPLSNTPQQTRSALLLDRASVDPPSQKLLALFGQHELSWADLYVALELMGDQRRLRERGYALRQVLSRLFQTANFHRHGKGVTLPAEPFTLEAASNLVREFAMRWLQERHGAA